MLIFIYFVPGDSRYFRDDSFTEFFDALSAVTKSGKTVIVVGDHNGRFGKLEFHNRLYVQNVDTTKNAQGELLRSIYCECGFYPLNHLQTGNRIFHGDFTFIRGEKQSQVDFLFTNKHANITQSGIDNN